MIKKYSIGKLPDVPDWVGWDGHFNHLPVNATPSTEDEYWHYCGSSLKLIEFNLQSNIDGRHRDVNVEVYHDFAFGIVRPNKWRCATAEEKAAGKYGIVFEEPVLYFRFGCIHEWDRKSLGSCLSLWTCRKCGSSKQVDSSD